MQMSDLVDVMTYLSIANGLISGKFITILLSLYMGFCFLFISFFSIHKELDECIMNCHRRKRTVTEI